MRNPSHPRSLSSAVLSALRKTCLVAAAVLRLIVPAMDASAEIPPDFQWVTTVTGSYLVPGMDMGGDRKGSIVLAEIFYNYVTVTMVGITLINAVFFLIKF